MTQIKHRMFHAALAVFLLLGACAPAGEPTQSLEEIQNQVATMVALTVQAQNAETAAAQPAATETPVPSPTAVVIPTITPILPTATPFVVVPPTSGGGGGGSVPKPKYDCGVFPKRPYDNTAFRPNDPFDIKWTIINTGTETWEAGLDLKYYSGPQMTSVTLVELPKMKPNDTFSVVFDAFAPAEKGHHVMSWVVEGGICYPYVAIDVE